MNLKLSLILILFLNLIKAQSSLEPDIVIIPMKPDLSGKTIVNTRSTFSNLKDSISFTGIPKELINYRLKFFTFNPAQHHYDRYRKGLLPKPDFDKWFKHLSFDSSHVSSRYFKHITYAITGLTSNGNKLVILDINQNLDFSDDQKMEFDTVFFSLSSEEKKKKLNQLSKVKLQYEYIDKQGIISLKYTNFRV